MLAFKLTAKDLLIDTNSSINIVNMSFLSIDCSTEKSSLFIKTKSKTFIKFLQSDKSYNDLLMKQILVFFTQNNLKFEDISNILVNQGPGNFSGLRGSLAIAKGISLSKNLKLFGYNMFIWPCANFFNKSEYIYSLIKFRDKYFIQKFNKNLISVSNAQVIKEEDLVEKYEDELKVVPQNLKNVFGKKILELNNLNFVNLDYNQLEFLQLKGLLDKDLIKPLYLS